MKIQALKMKKIITINDVIIGVEVTSDGVTLPCNRFLKKLVRQRLNELAEMVEDGMVSQDERRFIYQNIGYTLDGYKELFPEDVIGEVEEI